MSRADNCEDEAEREEVELEDAMSQEVFDPEAKVFNMQKQRVTDLKHNAFTSSYLPPRRLKTVDTIPSMDLMDSCQHVQ